MALARQELDGAGIGASHGQRSLAHTRTARRALLVTALIGVAAAVAACGRATEEDINQALGITPTPTASAAQIATGTAAASATAAARAAAASSPGAGPAVALGDVTRGRRHFQTQCAGCHRPGGAGPDILAAGGAGANVTLESLEPLIREGTGHSPPGPYRTTEISDAALRDIAAYIRSSAGP